LIINNMEVDFKITRPKDAAAFEKALEKLAENEIELKQDRKKQDLSTMISNMITMFQEFLKNATGVDILKDCEDLELAQEVYYQFCRDVESQKKKLLPPYSVARIK